MSHIPTVKLNNGLQFPAVGLGTYKEDKPEVLINAVKAAVKAGYRHFDCAYIYFNEQHIGKGIREAIEESNGSLKREDFFIVSKCWNACHSTPKVSQCLDGILDRLGFDYLDLYLMHWPMGFKEDAGDCPEDENGKCIDSGIHYTDTYKAMEELVGTGKVKSIGLSNFNPSQLKDILAICKIKPVCNQFEVNPFLPNDEWVDACQKENIAVVAYAPFGAPDRPWQKSNDPVPLKYPLIVSLAEKYKKSPGQIILRWLNQRGIVSIPKSVTPSRIAENAQIFDFELSAEEMQAFKDIKERFRFYVWEYANNHPFYPFGKVQQ